MPAHGDDGNRHERRARAGAADAAAKPSRSPGPRSQWSDRSSRSSSNPGHDQVAQSRGRHRNIRSASTPHPRPAVFHLLLRPAGTGLTAADSILQCATFCIGTSNGRLPYKPRDFRRGHSLVLRVRASTVPLRRRVILGKQRPAESKREADLPTEQAGAQAPPRFSRPHGDQGWAQDRGQAARARTQTAQCLIGDRDAAGIGTVEGLRLTGPVSGGGGRR